MMSMEGVTFESVCGALCAIYYVEDPENATKEDWAKAKAHVLPMKHNFMNPIKDPSSEDTYIEYWIDDDDRLTQDFQKDIYEITDHDKGTVSPVGISECEKVARVTIRFIGAQAEYWAKMMHHSIKRDSFAVMFNEFCNAKALEYIGSIRPVNIDYFGTQNSVIAFDTTIQLVYGDVIRLTMSPLETLQVGGGTLNQDKEGITNEH